MLWNGERQNGVHAHEAQNRKETGGMAIIIINRKSLGGSGAVGENDEASGGGDMRRSMPNNFAAYLAALKENYGGGEGDISVCNAALSTLA